MDWITAISTVGFPIVAFFYLAFKIDKTVENNTKALNEIKIVMQQCKK